jgi:hypothetical protein
MAHDRQNPLERDSDESPKTRFVVLGEILKRWFTKWKDAFPTHEITQTQILTYLEALDDLSPNELNRACREATRTADQFPKPGHIRKALEASRVEESVQHNRPAYLDEPRLSDEEIAAALEETKQLREQLKKTVREKSIPQAAATDFFVPRQTYLTVEEQQATAQAYRQYLRGEAEKEISNRRKGLPPVPRSVDEAQAIYFEMTPDERRRFQKLQA